jgi:lipopolysaccharide/colanic/teichoic acid biosynthesis glycosyltransferase
MSLAGPRPRLPAEFDLSVPRQRRRFIRKPGLAGLWQVRWRARLNFEQALAMNLEYIRRWSFLFDQELIARTAMGCGHLPGGALTPTAYAPYPFSQTRG